MITNSESTVVLTPEQRKMEATYCEEMDAAYDRYVEQRTAYEKLIRLEDDPTRKGMLEAFLADLNEENK